MYCIKVYVLLLDSIQIVPQYIYLIFLVHLQCHVSVQLVPEPTLLSHRFNFLLFSSLDVRLSQTSFNIENI